MSKARHGGKMEGAEHHDKESKPKLYDAEGTAAGKDAEDEGEKDDGMNKGGRARKKRADGGRMEHHKKHEGHKVEGHHGKKRMDRAARKSGGGVGADKHPLSTAAKVTNAEDHKAEDGNSEGD